MHTFQRLIPHEFHSGAWEKASLAFLMTELSVIICIDSPSPTLKKGSLIFKALLVG